MRKYVVAGLAAGWIGTAFAAGAPENQFNQYSAQARAYMTYDFGGAPHRSQALPLHYGFRVDSESRLAEERFTGLADHRFPALVQFDFAADGQRLALLNGLPFAGRSIVLRQDGDSSAPAPAQGEPGGFTWFDWGLLIAGLGGVGYIIAEVSKGHDDPDPPANNNNAGATNAGGTVVGTVTGVVNTVTGTVTGVVNTVTGVVNGVANAATGFTGTRSVEGALPFDPVDRQDPAYRKWLDGGSGQMGDLGG